WQAQGRYWRAASQPAYESRTDNFLKHTLRHRTGRFGSIVVTFYSSLTLAVCTTIFFGTKKKTGLSRRK
ncbi:MAG: hypothetical protein ACLFVC_03045, partial [Opitutales bacterium]